MTKPRVDILLPYWGEFTLLKKTIESILAQTSTEWRLQVFDDCYPSLDASHYFNQLNDPRVIYFRHKKNIGITKNFNYALAHANAEYCMLIGCDDIMLPNYIETALAHIGDADFYQPGVNCIDKDDNIYSPLTDRVKKILRPSKPGYYHGEKLAISLCSGNWLYFPSILWRTDIIKQYGFNEKYKIAEDLDLELKIITANGTLALDNSVTFLYRRFAESLSSREKSKGGIRFTEEREVYSYHKKRFSNIGWRHAELAANLRITSRINYILSK